MVYLRQSTTHQVESNRESTNRQYALAQRASQLGWDQSLIQILDADLGKSGQTTAGREDFHRLMAAVSMGEVGAVLALEASRFSRSQADWHKLVDICALTDTLVIDHDGIYNPNDFNDRVLLGFKGTWSHTELHGMRLRLQGAKLNKAKKGELRCTPPTGYIYDPDGRMVLDPDESVVATIGMVFEQFRLLGTAFKVMRYFAQNNIPFPRRIWRPGESGTLKWGSVNLNRILAILHNPTYTGSYVYGRRRSQSIIQSGEITSKRTIAVPPEEWIVMIRDAHPAYISFEEYKENEAQLTRNLGNQALLLNQRGFVSGIGRAFTAASVAWIRGKYQIPKPLSSNTFAGNVGIRTDGSYSTSALAKKLGVGIHTIHYWREQGVIEATRETEHGPWWYQVTPEVLQLLREKIRRVPVLDE